MAASTPLPMPAWQSWFLPGGRHLMVMKNLLPSGTHFGTVCDSFLRAGKYTGI